MTLLIDLSHTVRDGMMAYPGLPSPEISAIRDHGESRPIYAYRAEFHLGKVCFPGNTGTYLDSPFHRYPSGQDLSQLPLGRLAFLPGLVLDAAYESGRSRCLSPECDASLARGRAVLIRTGWDRFWQTEDYWKGGPFLSSAFAGMLVEAGAALVGVDFGNVDDPADPSRPVHTLLLGKGIPIVENLRGLKLLPREGFYFSAVPPKIERGSSFPVRAFALIQEQQI